MKGIDWRQPRNRRPPAARTDENVAKIQDRLRSDHQNYGRGVELESDDH